MVLYGSCTKGNYKNGSDIDLTLCSCTDLTLDVQYKIMEELEEMLMPYTIDPSIFPNISDPNVVEHIRRLGVTFYEGVCNSKTNKNDIGGVVYVIGHT
ncbi:MAG: polymerase beta domain protein region [Candidatus Brocadiaceae bacterium]|nr:polymerase beta domain protein region [Candidatus Brocadiaceae bacterium]